MALRENKNPCYAPAIVASSFNDDVRVSTLVDLLSWTVAVTLGAKVLATLTLLNFDKIVWDRPGWGAILWWSAKITPIIAVPCVICLAWLQGMTDQVWIFVGLMVFVMVAVPWKIRQRRARIADRATVISSW